MRTFQLAWRNIWRNRRRTLVTVGAMTIALVCTTLYGAMVQGYLATLERDALDAEMGVAQVFAPGYQERPSIYAVIPDADALVARLDAAGMTACARLLGGGLVAAGESSAGAQFRGIDVQRDAAVLVVSRGVVDGAWLDEADPAGVVLGRRLAHTLGVKPGDELVLLSQATDGSIANQLATVRGVLASVGEATDRAGVFLTARAFREFFALEQGAHQVIVKRPDVVDLPALEARITAAAPGQQVLTWRRLMPTVATMIDSVRGLVAFMFFIVNVAIAIVILNAMLMAVFERIREFGILKALGVGPLEVLRLIYAESLFQVVIALGASLVLETPLLVLLSARGLDMSSLAGVSAVGITMASRWYAVVGVSTFTGPAAMMFFVVAAAVLYPAAKAAVIDPVEAMRHA
ncbi:MAG: ABC transporter permease [Deltaproteobacteria bacterium]|nr:ABC transporter permease [Deltaproteobacteria bacterium]